MSSTSTAHDETIPGEGWFVLPRLCGREQAILDRSWVPNDIEHIDNPA